MDKPKLRHIEAIPTEANGERIVYLRDPQNLSGRILAVSPETLIILSQFDGKNSVSDIGQTLSDKFGDLVRKEDIEELVRQLDEVLFLDSEKYRNYKNKLESDFKKAGKRKPSHAGLSYPDDYGELSEWFRTFFDKAEETRPYKVPSTKPTGLISPHIDYRRGGISYALAYRELLNRNEADTYVIFGTSHYTEVNNPFILTKKSFDTPFGETCTDNGFVDRVSEACSWDVFEGEISHRTEHSIEFQVAMLQYILKGKKDFKIVPILCNSFYNFVNDGKSPGEDERISVFLETVSDITSQMGDRVFTIAGADMAHVGPKFGDREPVNELMLEKIKERDTLSLTCSENLDAEGFYRSVEEEKDWRKICGLSPIYATLATIQAGNGKLLDYDQALEPDTGSVVSFASMVFYR
jgi:AmmeMemoRadiSam system protein B